MELANTDPVSIFPSQIPSVPVQPNDLISYFISAYAVLEYSPPPHTVQHPHFLCVWPRRILLQKNGWCPKETSFSYTSRRPEPLDFAGGHSEKFILCMLNPAHKTTYLVIWLSLAPKFCTFYFIQLMTRTQLMLQLYSKLSFSTILV